MRSTAAARKADTGARMSSRRRSSPLRPGMTIPAGLDAAVQQLPRRVSLVSGTSRQSLLEIRRGARVIARQLERRGVRPHDRVCLLAPNGAAYAHALFGILATGAECVPLDPRFQPSEIAQLVQTLRPTASVHDRSIASSLATCFAEAGVQVVAVPPEGARPDGSSDVERPLADGIDTAVQPSDTAMVFLTSGTTTAPKAVRHSHRSLIGSTMALHRLRDAFFSEHKGVDRFRTSLRLLGRYGIKLLRATRQLVWMTPMPYCTIGGHEVLFGALFGGARLIAASGFHPLRTLELVEREHVNILALTPGMAEALVRVRHVQPSRLSSLLIIGIGGGPVRAEVAEKLGARFRCAVTIGYGSTELGGGVLVTRLEDPESSQVSTVGRPFPGTSVRVVDDQKRDVAPGTTGQLLCRGPGIAAGYSLGGRVTELPADADWYLTGDVAVRNADGTVSIVGRMDELIIRGGQNISPLEIERAIQRLPDVDGAAVVAVPADSEQGLWAFVVPGPGADIDTSLILDHCRRHLAAYKVPDHVRFVGVLPETVQGDVQRFRLVERARAELAGGSGQ
jgi:acyl-CoA synthetase (AMP-forming)/AMP-acid ligase II